MNNNPIGVFDSGIGGLTVVSQLMKQLPNEDIIYFGDTARVPYGSKSKEVVTKFSRQIASFLLSKKVKMIVVACNTASAFALESLKKELNVPVLGVIEPGANAAVESTRTNRVGIVGTVGTINSSSYTKAINKIDKTKKIFPQACPLFVPLVEEGWLDHKVTYEIAKEYLAGINKKHVDTLILGCTHYPLLKKAIQKTAGRNVKLIDSATATAKETKSILEANGLAVKKKRKPSYSFYVSDSPEKFKKIGGMFLGRKLAKVEKVSVEEK